MVYLYGTNCLGNKDFGIKGCKSYIKMARLAVLKIMND